MKYFIGIKNGTHTVFGAKDASQKTHGHLYNALIGPFKHKHAAKFMVDTNPNPHCQSVMDAERISQSLRNKN